MVRGNNKDLYMVVWGIYGRGKLNSEYRQIGEERYKLLHKKSEKDARRNFEVNEDELSKVIGKGTFMDLKKILPSVEVRIKEVRKFEDF